MVPSSPMTFAVLVSVWNTRGICVHSVPLQVAIPIVILGRLTADNIELTRTDLPDARVSRLRKLCSASMGTFAARGLIGHHWSGAEDID